jgi:hypothetical protein
MRAVAMRFGRGCVRSVSVACRDDPTGRVMRAVAMRFGRHAVKSGHSAGVSTQSHNERTGASWHGQAHGHAHGRGLAQARLRTGAG